MRRIETGTKLAWIAVCLPAVLAVDACEKPKQPVPEAVASAPSAAPVAKKSEDEDDESTGEAVVALPPGQTLPDAAAPVEHAPRTGVCSMLDTGYDGADTKSTEKLIVKIKDEKIAAAEYSYRGSYALDGKVANLSIPLREGKWLEFEMPMTTGSKKFKLKVKNDDAEFKGTAAQGKQGSCTWEQAPKPKKKKH